MLASWYRRLRVTAYAAGIAGLILFLVGPRFFPAHTAVQATGCVLLIGMFCLFLVSYVLYIVVRARRR
jgi:hypothetical protein